MIAEVAAQIPDSLAAYRGSVASGPGGPNARSLHEPAVFDATLRAFGAGFGPADLRVLVSYWSQFYFALIATPALTALLRLDRPLPLAFEATSLELDADGRPLRLLIALDTEWRDGSAPAGLTGLVESHLRPFVGLCHARCGIAPRVLWSNAAVIFDYVARQLDGTDAPAAAEIADCLGWRSGPACRMSPLARSLCSGAEGCRRRVCCLRHTLPGVPSCGALCPLEATRA